MPRSASRPSFDGDRTRPPTAWGAYDEVIAEAARLHWKVLLTVTSPVPRWATSNGKAPYITRPDARDFQEFMTAVGRHYGSEVSVFSIWNEPNHPAFLLPQWNSNGTPASPRIYRGLYQSGYAGLQAAGIARPQVLFGETAPTGYESVSVRKEGSRALLHDVAPLLFMREALCLNRSYRKAAGCSELQMAGYAHHAYTLPAGPFYVWPIADDVTIGSLSRLSQGPGPRRPGPRDPRRRARCTSPSSGSRACPNRELGVSAATQAQFQAIDERIAWSNPRVAAFSQYLLKDDPLGGPAGSSVHGGTVGFQTGLEYVNGKPKPLYSSFADPADRQQGRPRLLAVGAGQARHGRDQRHRLRPRQGSPLLPRAQDRHDQQPRLLVAELERRGPVLARALEEPHGRHIRRAGRSPPTSALGRSQAGSGSYDGSGCRSCPRLRSPRACWTGRCAASRIEYARAPGINALKTFEPPLSDLAGEHRVDGGQAQGQAPDPRQLRAACRC